MAREIISIAALGVITYAIYLIIGKLAKIKLIASNHNPDFHAGG